MTTSSISTFMSSFTKSLELARPSRFYVDFIIPDAVAKKSGKKSNGQGSVSQRLNLRCETAELPGKSFMTHDLKIYGPTEKFPYQHQYNDLNFTFIVSGDMLEKEIFDDWMDYISPPFIPSSQKTGTFDFKYKKSTNINEGGYSTDVIIYQLDTDDNFKYSVKLQEAFPIAVNQLDLDWSSDGHHKLNVTFAYTYWTKTTY